MQEDDGDGSVKVPPPPGFSEHVIMKEMGWSYQDLIATPGEVVDRTARILNTLQAWEEWESRKAEKK